MGKMVNNPMGTLENQVSVEKSGKIMLF